MGLAAVLILAGILCWLFVSGLLGIILIVVGIVMLLWAGTTFRGGYTGSRRYYY